MIVDCLQFVLCDCVMLAIMCVYFFFFKQKTAYEMRISDWSSDVCSSDLAGGKIHRAPSDIPGVGRFAVVADPQGAMFMLLQPNGPDQQIGRASCRERVCQYV